ncbi:MAG: phosphoribosyltransferase family protein [Campylobacterota bacterium]|nr:phosphoribosyltransferase family protein [Campylobacterota bacterium]
MKIDNIIFKDRKDATNQLLKVLPLESMKKDDWIVLSISKNAVSMAIDIAQELNGEFDFMLTEKILAPQNDECEIAIVTETNQIIIHEELMKLFSLDLKNIYKEGNLKYNEIIKGYKAKYRNSFDIIDLANKNVLLIDEGLNTGLTMMSCIKSAIVEKVKSVYVAVPVLPSVTIDDINLIADDLYYVQSPEHFISIEFYYEKLEELSLEDIKRLKGKICQQYVN